MGYNTGRKKVMATPEEEANIGATGVAQKGAAAVPGLESPGEKAGLPVER